jgi:hypothetical protein
MYKLLINQTKVYEGGMWGLLRYVVAHTPVTIHPGDRVEVYRKARTTWQLQDGGVWS